MEARTMTSEHIVTTSQNKVIDERSGRFTNHNIIKQPSTKRRATLINKNLLLSSANKVFSEIAHLKRRKNCEDIFQLRKHLLHEIQKFQIKAETLQYDTDSVLISRYALSATIDEIINKTPWGIQTKWQEHALLQELQQNANADEHFFTILDKICQAPNKFIDNIELMYVCLCLGFEGKFRHNPQEKLDLQKIVDEAYQITRVFRGEIEKRLSPTIKSTKTYAKKKRKHVSYWYITLLATAMIAGIYIGLNHQLKNYSAQLIQQVQHMANKNLAG